MKNQLNEIKRMQQLAGLLKENYQIKDKLSSIIDNANDVEINGSPVNMWFRATGKLLTADGQEYNLDEIINGTADLTIDGVEWNI